MTGHPPTPFVRSVTSLARTPGGLASLVGVTLAGLGGLFVTLADHLGFELALLLTVVSALTAPAAGASAVRRDPTRPARAALVAMTFAVAALLVPTVIVLLNGLRRPMCDPWAGTGWMLVLPIPSALFGAGLGAFARALAPTAKRAALYVTGALVLPLAWGLSTLYRGPAFFLFDHAFGYFPGPLYDEVVVFSGSVLAYRALTLAWVGALLLGCLALGTRKRRFGLMAVGVAVLAFGVEAAYGDTFGLRSTDASVARALGGTKTVDDLELHYPREWSDDQVDELVRDATFRATQVRESLGLAPGAPVRVWMHRSTEEKRRLVGAASTSFAKPWRREVHVHAMGFPHPVLRHELVHAYAAGVASGPFGTPGGFFPNNPLIEGFAVAFDVDDDGLTLDQWAKAMRDLELAPDVTALFSPAGFLTSAPSRAYTYAGAFLRFLERTFGREKVLELYRAGDLATLGDPKSLVERFHAHLESVAIAPPERASAQRRFSRPSVFRRNCAREVSALTDEAGRLVGEGRRDEALATWERACGMEPDDPGLLRAMLSTTVKLKDHARRDALAERIFAHPKLDASLRAGTLLELGDEAWRTGDLAAARKRFEEASALDIDAGTHRAAVAKTRSVADAARSTLLAPLLLEGNSGLGVMLALDAHLRASPEDALVSYLLGRQLVQRDARRLGIDHLRKAAELGLEDGELARENLRLLVRAQAELHDCDGAAATRARLQSEGAPADLVVADDWLDRCRFEVSRGWAAREAVAR